MTPSATHSQAHEPPRDDINLIIQGIMSGAKALPYSKKSQSSQCWVLIGQVQGISCQLLHDKTIIGKILLKGINDVIAVGVGKGKAGKTDGTSPMRVGIASNIKPMASPVFSVLA